MESLANLIVEYWFIAIPIALIIIGLAHGGKEKKFISGRIAGGGDPNPNYSKKFRIDRYKYLEYKRGLEK